MNDFSKTGVRVTSLKRYMVLLICGWTFITVASLLWNLYQEKQGLLELARSQARTAYEKDLVYRSWNAGLGGVYVPVTSETLPNPYLDVSERDIETPSGKKLTLINPAYMTRLVHKLGLRNYGLHGHITSLNPIRPENAADPWETEALKSFERGETEFSSVADLGGTPHMRLMRPLVTEKGCIKCHAAQGFKLGDIRGGISVAVSMAPLLAVSQEHTYMLWGAHSVFWLLGVAGIVLGVRSVQKSMNKVNRANEETRQQASIVDNSPSPMIQAHYDGSILRTNQAAQELFKKELVRESLTSLFPQFDDSFMSTMGDNRILQFEHTLSEKAFLFTVKSHPDTQILYLYGSDVSQLKQSQQKVKKAEADLDNVIESSLDSIIITDQLGAITRVNRAFRKLIGYEKEEIQAMHPAEFLPEADKCFETTTGETIKTDSSLYTGKNALMTRLYEDGKIENFESYRIRRDNTLVPVEMNASCLYNDNGEVIGSVTMLRDITERKIAESAIQKVKEHLCNVIDSSLDGIIIGDNTGNILDANRSFLQMLGYEKAELVGKQVMELSLTEEGTYESTSGEHIEIDGDFFNDARKNTDELLAKGKVSNWLTYYLCKEGKIVPLEMNIALLYDTEGTITGSVGIHRDISERRMAEAENIRLLEEAQNALEKLKQTQAHLLQSEKMASVGQLAAGVAHEINNPTGFVNSNLNSLSKYSNKLLELIKKYEEGLTSFKDNGNGKIAAFCEEIRELKKKLKIDFIIKDFQKIIADSLNGTQRIKKIVADLKNFSRVDQEELKPSDINEGIESTLNVVWNELKYKCAVEKDYGDLPRLLCNMGQLNQVFVNLLINASQAIEKKGTIKIATRYLNGHSEGGKNCIEIKVSDTGSGIPEEKRSRIFEPFFTTKDVGEGTGLGLSIAYDIIQKHKGNISVQSEEGKGTAFTITLPVIEAEGKEQSAS